jgi:hypothetical protein
MKALISPMEPRESGFRVAEVSAQGFPVADPLFWVDCSDDIVADQYWYKDGVFTLLPRYEPESPVEEF